MHSINPYAAPFPYPISTLLSYSQVCIAFDKEWYIRWDVLKKEKKGWGNDGAGGLAYMWRERKKGKERKGG